MNQLGSDIKAHPRSAIVFLAYYIGVWTHTWVSWDRGMSDLSLLLHFLAPVLAGTLVGWWRAPASEGLLVERRRLAGGPLAGALVAMTTVTLVFVDDALRRIAGGKFEPAHIVELVFSWIAASLILAVVALVLGLFGSLTGRAVAGLSSRSTMGR